MGIRHNRMVFALPRYRRGRDPLLLAGKIEVQATLHVQFVIDQLLHVAIEAALQRFHVDVEVVQDGAVIERRHHLTHHRRRDVLLLLGGLRSQRGATRRGPLHAVDQVLRV